MIGTANHISLFGKAVLHTIKKIYILYCYSSVRAFVSKIIHLAISHETGLRTVSTLNAF